MSQLEQFTHSQARRHPLVLLFALVACLALFGPAAIASSEQKHFSSPGEAAKALVDAARSEDRQAALAILGDDAKPIISSGDKLADANGRRRFVDRYNQMHRFVTETNGDQVLYIGAENYPFPIPLVKDSSGWYFNTPAGEREILYRRVGRNELDTIDVLNVLVAAQRTYFQQSHDGSEVKQYAAKLISSPGTQNGLYWPVTSGAPESPIGPYLAKASAQGYVKTPSSKPAPYHGYYYHVLAAQGASAPGGTKSYLADGKMTGGFAFIAYPAKYGNSGVMTFIVGSDGQVYQKDLGPETLQMARSMTEFNPDSSWQKVE